jgi:hypothetical protein
LKRIVIVAVASWTDPPSQCGADVTKSHLWLRRMAVQACGREVEELPKKSVTSHTPQLVGCAPKTVFGMKYAPKQFDPLKLLRAAAKAKRGPLEYRILPLH